MDRAGLHGLFAAGAGSRRADRLPVALGRMRSLDPADHEDASVMAGALERGWPLLLPAALLSVYGWAAWRRFRVSGTWPMDGTEPIRRWLEAPPVWAGVQPLLERPRLVLAFLEGACGKERLARWAAEGAGLAG